MKETRRRLISRPLRIRDLLTPPFGSRFTLGVLVVVWVYLYLLPLRPEKPNNEGEGVERQDNGA